MPNPTQPPAGTRILISLVPLLAALLLVIGAWLCLDLRAFDSPEKVAEAARRLAESPAGPAYALLAFALGTLLFVPVTPLVLGTALAFDPLPGMAYASLGLLLSAALTYGAGRLLGSAFVERLSGPRLARLARTLRANAFRAGIVARMLPVGNFTLINLVAGGMRIPLRRFLLGNAVGITPGVLVITLFARQLRSLDQQRVGMAVGALLLLGGLVLALRRIVKRRGAADDADASPARPSDSGAPPEQGAGRRT